MMYTIYVTELRREWTIGVEDKNYDHYFSTKKDTRKEALELVADFKVRFPSPEFNVWCYIEETVIKYVE